MTEKAIEQKKQHRQYLSAQLKDLFSLYLETDVAGDNEDRRSKLHAVAEIELILDDR